MPERDGPRIGVWRRWRSRRFAVVDDSMRPTLLPGDRVLVDPRAFRHRPPRVGEVVVLRDPQDPHRRLVKRVATWDEGTGTLSVRGDDPARSRDSRSFGAVSYRSVVGLVWFRYLPRERRGPLPAPGLPAAPPP